MATKSKAVWEWKIVRQATLDSFMKHRAAVYLGSIFPLASICCRQRVRRSQLLGIESWAHEPETD
jgi:hypothetical protein